MRNTPNRFPALRQAAARLLAPLALVLAILLPGAAAHAQSPLGKLSCTNPTGASFSADVYAFTMVASGGAELALDFASFPSQVLPTAPAQYATCVVSNGTSFLTFAGVQLEIATAYIQGQGTVSPQAERYTEIDLAYKTVAKSLTGSFPAPSATIGTLSCTGGASSSNFVASVYSLSIQPLPYTPMYAPIYNYELELDPSSYDPLAAMSSTGYSSCTFTAGKTTITWTGATGYGTLEGTGPGVNSANGQLFVSANFMAGSETVTGASTPSNQGTVTTLACQGPAFSAPVYAFTLNTFDPNANTFNGIQLLFNVSELPALKGGFDSCTLTNGNNTATLIYPSFVATSLEAVTSSSGTIDYYAAAGINPENVEINGLEVQPYPPGPFVAKPAATPTKASSPADTKAKVAELQKRMEQLLAPRLASSSF